jgi:hypothetical protein
MSSNFNDNGNDFDFKAYYLKSTQTITTAALVCAPVSLFVGGVILSIVAIIFSAISFKRTKSFMSSKQGAEVDSEARMFNQMYSRSKLALAISVGSLVLNIISTIRAVMILLSMFSGGDVSLLTDMLGSGEAISSSGSVWS